MKTNPIAPLLALCALLAACQPGPGGVTVNGTLLDPGGQPGAFLPVMVAGKVTSSDASGRFSVGGVTPPYQLVVLQPAFKYAQVYVGVTRPDPIVPVLPTTPQAQRKAKLTVNFSGTGTGNGLMDFANTLGVNGGVSGVGAPGTAYSTDLEWRGPSAFEGNVCAILYQSTANVATTINAFGQRDQVFVREGQTTTVNLSMGPVPTKTVSGAVSVPAGFTLTSKTLGFVCGNAPRPSYPFTFDTSPTPSFSYPAPVTPNPLHVGASAKKGDAYLYTQRFGVAPDASGVSLALPEPIEQLQPGNNAVGVKPDAALSWTPTALGLSQVYISPLTPGPISFTVYTPGSSLTLPDLSPLGYAWPKGTAYTWGVGADSNLTSVNDVLSGVPRDYLKSYSSAGTGERQFTTAP